MLLSDKIDSPKKKTRNILLADKNSSYRCHLEFRCVDLIEITQTSIKYTNLCKILLIS